LLSELTQVDDPRLLVGIGTRDDAGAYLVSDDLAIVQTVDFFTPIVDDPFDYGYIAAANSLSDAYAMGATPITALNIVGFPTTQLDISILGEILKGGSQAAKDAKVAILGGHSVKDPELKYGMAVTATARPSEIVKNSSLRVGDQLILTKPIGTGILTTALKQERLDDRLLQIITNVMKQLNHHASVIMRRHKVSACTDVTGFGLLGHLYEMTMEGGASVCLDAASVPLFEDVLALSEAGRVPGGLKTNRKYLSPSLHIIEGVSDALVNALCDPQTSGGLLFAIPEEEVTSCLQELHDAGIVDAAHVGEVVALGSHPITIR
tara:strand:+ start:40655 stop:41617 length:963 start_codon:yes stop_codon:yes gene_type:complete